MGYGYVTQWQRGDIKLSCVVGSTPTVSIWACGGMVHTVEDVIG